MTSKIEQIIEEMEQYIIEECKPYPLSKSKIIVDRDRIETMISELHMKMPGEIKKFQKFLENRNAILEDAQNKADAMLQNANDNVQKLVSDHEIVQMAQAEANAIIEEAQLRAQMILDGAQQEAEQLKAGSLSYVEESLENLQTLVGNTMTTVDSKMKGFMETLENYYTIIEENRNEIAAMGQPQPEEDGFVEEIVDESLQFSELGYEQ